MQDEDWNFIMFWIVTILGIIVGGSLTAHTLKKEFQRAAIQHNAAVWVTDQDGKSRFVWKDELPAKP